MTLQAQIVILEVAVLLLSACYLWNAISVHRTITTLWEMVKELQQRRLH